MKLTIEDANGGFIVTEEGQSQPKLYDARTERIIVMIEDIGRKVLGKRIGVVEK